ncbi:hypothetical protein TELCIR_03519 [Teladorsagia circumcincta]|uniref:BAR domain-containing protein n=1 Tax=Teladorsagia circumcincta TaxID=45464 RepID=A0A2G9UW35_TELCI|nr:hypothetical protein TELCIR_03519 [Teladorsagia circumcincta]
MLSPLCPQRFTYSSVQRAYSAAMKVLCQAEKALHETIRESYEAEWPEREQLTALLDSNEMEKVLCEDLPQAVSSYVSQFPELKKKVDKRGRKLVDYDHAKHSYSSAKASSKKGETDPKVAKAYTELQQAETFYKEINNELLEMGSHRSTPSPAPAPPPATPASLADSASGQAASVNNPFDEDNVEETFENKIYPKLAAAPRAEKVDRDNGKAEKERLKKEKDTKNPFDEDTDEEHPPAVPEEAPPTEHALEGVTKEARKVV